MIAGALVLAGGPAAQMEILCNGRSRPGLPFGGRLRIIDFTLSNCFFSEIPSIGVVTDRGSHAMWPYLRQWHMTGAGNRDVQVLEPEGNCRGTAHALYKNLRYIERLGGDTVLVLSADKIYQADYRNIIRQHENSGADATMAVIHLPLDGWYSGVSVNTDGDNRITGFAETHGMGSGFVSTGCYVFKKSVLLQSLSRDAAIPYSFHSLRGDVIPALAEHGDVRVYPFEGYWQDINRIHHYYNANIDFLNGRVIPAHDRAYPVRNPFSRQHLLSLTNSSHVKNSIIGKGCVIEGYVENSILSPGVKVDRQAEVWDSIVMSGVQIGSHSIIDHCIIDEDCEIGSQCYLGLGANFDPDRTSVTVLGKHVSVPANTSIGRNCRIFPYAGPGDFPVRVVPAGVTVNPHVNNLNAVL